MTLRVAPQEIVANSHSPLLAIADDWERVPLRHVAEITNGAAFKSAQFNNAGIGMPLIRIRDVDANATKTFYNGDFEQRHVVEDGDLLIGMDGDFRVARWAGPTALLNQRVCRVRVLDGSCFNETFLEHVLQPYLDAVHELTSAVTVKHLSSKTIGDLPIPLPPLPEQRQIVAAIEEHFSRLDAAEAYLEAALRRLAALREVATARLFSSEEWGWTTLGEIADVRGGVTKDSKRQDDPDFVEVPFLRVANVQRGYLNLSEMKTIRVPRVKAEALALEVGDVLFNEGGDRDKLGRGWVWDGQVDDCIHQNHVFRARLLSDDFDPRFVSTHGNTWGKRWFERNGKQTTNLASLNLTTLKRFPVPAAPMAEQQEIVGKLRRLEADTGRAEQDVTSARRRGAALRRSVLAAAFSGRLVPQDPSGEPASVLLERIAAERSAAKPSRRKRATA